MALNEACKFLIEEYFKLYPTMERIPVEIVFTDNLGATHLKLRPDRKEQLLERGLESDNNYNGRMVVPHKLDDTMYVLLNTQKVIEYTNDKSMTWAGTLAHELTHAIDYYQMARKESLESYDPLEETTSYSMFQLWSEYHARKLGYRFLREMLGVDKDSTIQNEVISHIKDTEWPFQKKRHYHEYHRDQNGWQQMYITMQLLGRYSVWCDLYPHSFNLSEIEAEFAYTPWMCHLFGFLYCHETLPQIYNYFNDMRLILRENWPAI